MKREIAKTWRRIRTWFEANAGSSDFKLPTGASDKAIALLEKVIGRELPEDVKESYRLHDGDAEFGLFPYGRSLLSLSEIEKEWRIWTEALRSGACERMRPAPRGPIRKVWWSVSWIPITGSGSGDHECVDLDPVAGGHNGQVIDFSHETGPQNVVATSFKEWLGRFADELEAGTYRYDEDSFTLLPVDEQ